MSGVKYKLAKWLKDNPDSWLTDSYKSIAQQTGVSAGSVERHLRHLVADLEGILPSEVLKRRQEVGGARPQRTKVDRDKIRKIIADNPDTPVWDLAYFAKCSERTIERELKAIESEGKGNSKDNSEEISEIKDQMAQLQARLNELSKD